MPGYSVPIVKAEVIEDGPAEKGKGGDKAEDEEVDFGEDGAAKAEGPPQRAMPDYGDLVDDDDGPPGAKEAKKEEDGGARGPAGPLRRDAIHMTGVQRLTRTHLAEIFDAKKLPQFRWVEWVEDDQVVCVFDTDKDALTALRGCEAGFGDSGAEDDKPGPGLWRAKRYMLDFRMATQADVPQADFKRKHRGGQQVREFRFWEAMKDMDKNILGGADAEALTRDLAPTGEDALAAADFDDDRQRRKRLRRGPAPGEEEEEEIDLLKRMSQLDKSILVKEESGQSMSLPKCNDASLVNVNFDEEGNNGDGGGRKRGRGGDDWWGGGDDWWGGGGQWDEWGGGQDDAGARNPRKRRRGGGAGARGGGGGGRGAAAEGDGGGGGGGEGGGGGRRTGAGAPGFELALDDEEQQRRAKRADRFKS